MERSTTPQPPEEEVADVGASSVATPVSLLPGHRGSQKRPTKILITLRLSLQVLDFFKETGKGWQTRVNDVLNTYVSKKRAAPPSDDSDASGS